MRHWNEDDLPLFAKLNADKAVMEYFPSTLSDSESNRLANVFIDELQTKPYGLWACEVKGLHPFIGFIGLHEQTFKAAFTPCIDIGWRLGKPFWGNGYATEGALRVLRYAFDDLHLEKVISITPKLNLRSIRLMKRIGLEYELDFDHPNVPKNSPLVPHVLYSKTL